MVIDSHQHFWHYDPDRHSWMNSEMNLLKRDYLPKELVKILTQNGVDGCVSVQASQSVSETDFLLKLADENEIIKGVVGWINLRADDIEEQLAKYATDNPTLKGFRHVIHDEPDVNFMFGDEFQRGLSQLEKYGFTYDILIYPIHMEATMKLVDHFPDQKFVIDHIAKPYINRGEITDWKNKLSIIGKNRNVWCKLSGMVTEADLKNWKYDDFEPYLDAVFETFGSDRIMFGSDWPVCLLSCDYDKMKGIADRYLTSFSQEDKDSVFGGSAIEFYDLEKE